MNWLTAEAPMEKCCKPDCSQWTNTKKLILILNERKLRKVEALERLGCDSTQAPGTPFRCSVTTLNLIATWNWVYGHMDLSLFIFSLLSYFLIPEQKLILFSMFCALSAKKCNQAVWKCKKRRLRPQWSLLDWSVAPHVKPFHLFPL